MLMSRSSVPEDRSRSMAMEATMNMTMKGTSPMSGGPTRWKVSG
jgi:hypothetical protein